jgi:hypothetical protein
MMAIASNADPEQDFCVADPNNPTVVNGLVCKNPAFVKANDFMFTGLATLGNINDVATPLLEKCEDETHTPEMGTWESTGTPETSEFNCRGQNTLPWGVLYIIGNLLKRRCRKWTRMSHLKICSTSYGKKKGWESNWQFDSRPPKVGN